MRIVAHNGARIWGGAERATVSLLSGLQGRGHDVLLLCNDPLVASEAASRGVPSRICAIGGDVMLHHALRLARVLEQIAPDAFIVGTYKKLFLATLGARLAHVPRIVARVGLESDTPRSRKYKIALRRWTDGVAVNARRIVAPFAELEGFGPEKVALIWNSVATESYESGSGGVRRELGIRGDEFVIGTVARLAKQKRLDRLIRALQKLPGAHCIIAGDGSARTGLQQIAVGAGVADRVHFLGNRADVHDIIDALDVFVLTSDSEGMSNAMLEAMAHGRPVVSTDVSGAEDALSGPPAAGIIVGFDDVAVARAISTLRDDPRLRESMGRAGKERVMREFSREAMLDAWEKFLAPAGTNVR